MLSTEKRLILQLATIVVLSLMGCTSLMDRRSETEIRRDDVRKRLQAENRPTIIKQVASSRQLAFAAVKNIGLVTHLADTGGPVATSAQRERILDAMRRNEVPEPNRLLDSKETAMVIVTAPIPPSAQAGDRVNVVVQLSKHSQAQDLRQGWLRETPLMEIAQFEGKVRTSFDYAKAEGSLVTNSQYSGEDSEQAKLEAIVVGGAKLLKSRDVGLGLAEEYADAITMAAIIPAINSRFTYFDGRSHKGVGTPMSDEYVDLHIPPKYKHDPFHFMNVVLHIGFNETDVQKEARLARLKTELNDAALVRQACWQLEGLGNSTVDILAEQLNNPSAEIRFYCAHSMAYLGDHRAIEVLKEMASTQAAFRAMSLNALSAMESYHAESALKALLSDAEPEARYGAVRALRRRNPRNPLIVAQVLPQVGGQLEVPTSGTSLVAVSMSEIPEIVFFGQVPELKLPAFHNVNPNILIKADGAQHLLITRFAADEEDRVVRCRSDLRSVLQGIAQVGGGYGDWVSFVRECQQLGFISIPVAMNPIPTTGRTFDRELQTSVEKEPLVTEDQSIEPTDEQMTQWTWYKPWTWRNQ